MQLIAKQYDRFSFWRLFSTGSFFCLLLCLLSQWIHFTLVKNWQQFDTTFLLSKYAIGSLDDFGTIEKRLPWVHRGSLADVLEASSRTRRRTCRCPATPDPSRWSCRSAWKRCQRLDRHQGEHKVAKHDIVLKKKANPGPFLLIVNLFKHKFYRINCRHQWDSNSDRRKRRRARRPLDHHHTVYAISLPKTS